MHKTHATIFFMRLLNAKLSNLIAEFRHIGLEQHGPSTRKAGGDDPQSGRLIHAYCDEDDARPCAQDDHDDDHQQRQRFHQRGAASPSVRFW